MGSAVPQRDLFLPANMNMDDIRIPGHYSVTDPYYGVSGVPSALFTGTFRVEVRQNNAPAGALQIRQIFTNVSTTGANYIRTWNGATTDWSTPIQVRPTAPIAPTRQYFNANGTYTPPAAMTWCEVWCVGGGGGSGGCTASTAGNLQVSGSGGGGAIQMARYTKATIGTSKAVVIGAGGTAGAITGTAGGDGGTSTFGGSLLSAPGGGGGIGSSTNATSATVFGGAGGDGETIPPGTLNGLWLDGSNGESSAGLLSGTIYFVHIGHPGGPALPGGHFLPLTNLVRTFTAATSQQGTAYIKGLGGVGGRGGFTANNSGTVAGAAGQAGFVLVHEYYN